LDLKENEKLIYADMENLSYSGRIDFLDPKAPIFIFPGSSVSMLFKGSNLKALIKNNHDYNDHNYNYLGCILDGIEKIIFISNDDSIQEITLAEDLETNKTHEVILFKRQDGCHEFTFYGFIISKGDEVNLPYKKTSRYMEFYGDSAASGELIEGEYSNAWYSYAMMTARNLKANVNIIAQSGIALLDNSGYFHAPKSIGMESIYDKLHFNPSLGKVTDWNFKEYNPQVVVIDIGQYDAFPEDYMKINKDSEKSKFWKRHYKDFVLNIREKYPSAFIVLTTTITNHHSSWDRSIGIICREINDENIVHFLYSNNGCGTSSFIKKKDAEQMAFELSIFLKGFGNKIWLK